MKNRDELIVEINDNLELIRKELDGVVKAKSIIFPEEKYDMDLVVDVHHWLQHYIESCVKRVIVARNLVSESQWISYKSLGIIGLWEQKERNNAEAHAKKRWKDRHPALVSASRKLGVSGDANGSAAQVCSQDGQVSE